MKSRASSTNSSKKGGFTLIELLVVSAITIFLATFISLNLRYRIDLNAAANVIISDIRNSQAKAISSAKYNNGLRCGYGIRYLNSTSYSMYVGPNASTTDCSTIDTRFNNGQDFDILIERFIDQRIEIKSPFHDIFYEPPDPKTFIDNDSSLNRTPEQIIIGKIGGICPQYCKTINVYTTGKIQ